MNNEYFVHDRAPNDSNPLVAVQDGESRDDLLYSKAVDLKIFDGAPLKLRLGKPTPKKPVMVDYHSQPKPVISKKLFDVLAPLDLHRVQLVPSVVELKGKALPYWFVHNYNRLSCIDEQRSKVTFNDRHDRLRTVERLVLDEGVLSKLPLRERLYFTLVEDISIYVMHESVHDAILAAKPEGIRFWPVNQWSTSAQFS